MVINKTVAEPPISQNEILRYAGCKGMADESLQFLLDECLEEVRPKLSYKVCYTELPLMITGDICDFEWMQVRSKDLVKNLEGCKRVVLFAATIGVEMDRLIRKYGSISPVKAVMFQAIGAERIESLCDVFCGELEQEVCGLRPRFSAGYGDLSLETQKDIFRVLQCEKNIGVSLNNSLLMSPSKSVTAFIGISDNGTNTKNIHNCMKCKKSDCIYRI